MKVTYIHHSAFLVETEHVSLLFDYFEGTLPEIAQGKPLYVFASHRHPDHFSKIIFELFENRTDVSYILSSDIWRKRVPDSRKDRTVFMKPGEKMNFQAGAVEMTVETFQSTDEGVAFWCSVDGEEIYHAGDLNHWYWEEEDEAWNRDMTAAYRKEIAKMAGRTASAAFLPLDPRLEQWFFLGIDDFMRTADAKKIFPMHFWKQYDVAARLKKLPCSEPYRDRIIEIIRDGQEFTA